MRRTLFSILVLLAAAANSPAEGINFTPHTTASRMDGTTIVRIAFRSPDGSISVRLPRDWDVVGNPDDLHIASRSMREAEGRLENGPTLAPAFDEAGLQKYRDAAEHLLPKQAEDVAPIEEKLDSLTINDWQSFEKTFAYRIAGRKFVRRILFLKLDAAREVRLVVDTLEPDAEKFFGQFRAVFNSWLETKE